MSKTKTLKGYIPKDVHKTRYRTKVKVHSHRELLEEALDDEVEEEAQSVAHTTLSDLQRIKERWVRDYRKVVIKRLKGESLGKVDTFILEHFSKYAKDYEDELCLNVLDMDILEEDYKNLVQEECWPDYDDVYDDDELNFNAHLLREMSLTKN
tara:strand:- start:120 stop:578 length:459 start_codon:yes stop_codon:yes gene_type:complete